MSIPVSRGSLGWGGIVRLGLVQAAIGSIVVLATSTMNRVMVVELAMPAVLPGLLVALHYVVQMTRARFGHGSDIGGRLTRWIIGGMAVLAIGGIGAAASVGLMAFDRSAGVIAAVASFLVIGLGVGACGTSLLVLLAKSVDASRRPAAATITWLMMFVGFVITTAVAGQLLEPYSHLRLLAVTAGVALVSMFVTVLATGDIERKVASLQGSALAEIAMPSTRQIPRGALTGLERNGGAALHDFHLRLHARLQRSGADLRAVRRLRVSPVASSVDATHLIATRWRSRGDAAGRGAGQPAGALENRLVARLDGRRLHCLGRGARGVGRGWIGPSHLALAL